MSRHTRRRALLGASAVAVAGGWSLVTQTTTAAAQVSGDFRVPDARRTVTDTQLTDVRLAVDATYSYDANVPIHGVEVELHVGAGPDTLDLIARHRRDDLGTDSLTGEETLNGSLMSASDFTIDDFRPSDGRLTRRVTAALRLYVTRDGDVVADAEQVTQFAVTVTDEEVTVTTTLGGVGEVTFTTGDG